jgi:CxxC motif-containing protein
MNKEIICIGCPIGCPLKIIYDQKKVLSVQGNKCKVGLDYAEKECFNPERTLTTTVRVKNGQLPLVGVRTSKPIPKNLIFKTMNLIAKVEVEAPINIGEIIIENLFNTDANIIATKNVIKN